MKKVIALSTLTLLLCLSFGLSRSFAGGCSVNCKFSSCTIGGCTGQYACGCYFGIASCKCEANTGGSKTSKAFNSASISDFNVYAINSGYQGLIAVGNTLKSFTEENFDIVFESYKSQISRLTDRELELLKLYVEQ